MRTIRIRQSLAETANCQSTDALEQEVEEGVSDTADADEIEASFVGDTRPARPRNEGDLIDRSYGRIATAQN